jgi:hypothetical protein
MYRILAYPFVCRYRQNSVEKILKRSLDILDEKTVNEICDYVRGAQNSGGGFADRAGLPDLYYSLFGFWLSGALDLQSLFPSLSSYLIHEIRDRPPAGIHAHCAAIIAAGLDQEGNPLKIPDPLKKSGRVHEKNQAANTGIPRHYDAFVQMLSSWSRRDYKSLLNLQKKWGFTKAGSSYPGPVVAASLILRKVLGKGPGGLEKILLSFYDGKGGFKATGDTALSDLLSTGIALYALRVSGTDIREIVPLCLEYVDSLYKDGGFCGNTLDPDTDLEYTFYGLLALGALGT